MALHRGAMQRGLAFLELLRLEALLQQIAFSGVPGYAWLFPRLLRLWPQPIFDHALRHQTKVMPGHTKVFVVRIHYDMLLFIAFLPEWLYTTWDTKTGACPAN